MTRLILLLPFLIMTRTLAEAPPVRLTSGLQRIPVHRVAAEMTEVIHLVRPLPVIPTDRILNQTRMVVETLPLLLPLSTQLLSTWNDTVASVLGLVRIERAGEVTASHRRARGLAFLGSVFSFCCDLVTEQQLAPLTKDVDSVVQTMRQLVSAQAALEGNQATIVAQMSNFSAKVADSFEHFRREISLNAAQWTDEKERMMSAMRYLVLITQITTTVMEIVSEQQVLQEIFNSCQEGQLSTQLLPEDELEQQVALLLQKPSFREVQLAVENYQLLYSEKLTTCVMDESVINFWLKIPLKKFGTNWQIQRYSAIPFAYEDSLCTVFGEGDELLIATSERVMIPITGTAKRHCLANTICQVPRIDMSFTADGECVQALLEKSKISEVLPYCSFHCRHTDRPEILQLAPDQFVVATRQGTSIKTVCGRKETAQETLEYGSYKFWFPVNCTLQINGEVAVHEREIIAATAATTPRAEILLPAMWTVHLDIDVESLRDTSSGPLLANMAESVNASWLYHSTTFFTPSKIPVVTLPKLSGVQLKAYRFFPGEDVAVALSIVVLFGLVGILIFGFGMLYFKLKYVLQSPNQEQVSHGGQRGGVSGPPAGVSGEIPMQELQDSRSRRPLPAPPST